MNIKEKKIGLFIPCYIDQFYPHVGIATLELLQQQGLRVHYPLKQTCCGQPLANSGAEKRAQRVRLRGFAFGKLCVPRSRTL